MRFPGRLGRAASATQRILPALRLVGQAMDVLLPFGLRPNAVRLPPQLRLPLGHGSAVAGSLPVSLIRDPRQFSQQAALANAWRETTSDQELRLDAWTYARLIAVDVGSPKASRVASTRRTILDKHRRIRRMGTALSGVVSSYSCAYRELGAADSARTMGTRGTAELQ